MGDFFKTLIPWANMWNEIILSLDITLCIVLWYSYAKTKSRSLLNAMPGIFTSLGILGTFCAICSSLSGISMEVETVDNVGKTLGEVSSTVSKGSLDIKRIISDMIPAFSTSIYGLVFAIFATVIAKIQFAREDAQLANSLKYKDPESALEAMDDHILALTEASVANNDRLNDSIQAQSEILSKFVESFVERMESTFDAMNTVIEQRVTDFGTTQYTQSRQLLENLTQQLGAEATAILNSHTASVKTMAESGTAELTALKNALTTAVENLKTDTVVSIEELTRQQNTSLQKLAEDSLTLHQQAISEQSQFNETLLHNMSDSLTRTTETILSGIRVQIGELQNAVASSIQQLRDSYDFIDEKSASIVSNYEQASEAYRDAVQNAHDLNESVEKGIKEANESLKAVGLTNDNVGRIAKLIEDKETSMEAILMRIESLNSAIASLQKLESALSRITPK